MALRCNFLIILTLITIFLSSTSSFSAVIDSFSTKLSREAFGLHKEEKLTRLHFYMSDIFGGENATAIPVTNILVNATFYGAICMADDPLTLGPELTSTSVGRARGIYSFTSPNDFVFEMVYNLAFTRGVYNGSTLALVGSIFPSLNVNELSVVGGTGVFRFGRGYAITNTTLFDPTTSLAVRELTVYVSHY